MPDSKKARLIKIDGVVNKDQSVEFTQEEADNFTDDFILFIASKKLFFSGVIKAVKLKRGNNGENPLS